MMHKTTRFLPFLLVAACALYTCSAHATTYYWIGGDSADWANGSNWSLTEGGAAANAYPGASDAATFGGNASLTMSAGVNVSNIAISAGVRVQFSSSDYKVLQVNAVTADATSTLALSNVIVIPAVNNAPISGQIELVAGSTNGLYGASGKNLNINGNLTGAGEVYFRNYATSGSRGGVNLNGDNSQFSGVAHILMAEGLDMRGSKGYATTFKWTTLESGSANARWIIEGSDSTNGPLFPSASLTSAENPFKLGTLEGAKSVTGGANAVFYLELGNGQDFEYGGTIKRGSNSNGFKLTKVGTGTMTFSGGIEDKNTTSSVTIKEGSVKFCKVASLPAAGIIMAGGGLKAGVEGGVKVDLSSKISTSSTAAVVYDDEGDDSIWASLGAVTTGLVKKGSGSLTIKSTSYTGETVVEAGRLNLPAGMTIASLDVEDGAALGLYSTEAYSEPTAVFTITSVSLGVNLATAIPNTATQTFSFEVDEGTGAVMVKAVRSACVFTWTGSVDSSWEKVANWQVGGQAVTELPTSIDMVVFPAAETPWDVSLLADATVAKVQFNGATTLSNAMVFCTNVTATAEVTLCDGSGFGDTGSGLSLADMNISITASTNAPARFLRTTANGALTIPSSCVIKGTGAFRLECAVDMANNDGTYLAATMGEFAGTVYLVRASGGSQRDNTKLAPHASSSNAVWMASNYSRESRPFFGSGIYYFGGINGSLNHNNQSQTGSEYAYLMEIGHLGREDTLSGRFFSSTYTERIAEAKYQAVLRKVGNGTLTFTGREIAKYEINGGVLYCKTNACFETYWSISGGTQPYSETLVTDGQEWHTPITFGGNGGTLKLDEVVTLDLSTNFVNSTTAVSIDDGGVDRIWTGVIAASNVGGLTKKGAGTLTLTAVPEYSGMTTVEDGMLVVPQGTTLGLVNALSIGKITGATVTDYAYAEGAEIVVDYASGSVVYDAPVDIANIASIDASAITLTKGQPYVIASATTITGYTKSTLASVALTLPDGVDASKWVLKVMTMGNARCLCVAPATNPFIIIVR